MTEIIPLTPPARGHTYRTRVVKHRGSAIMCRNAGEKVIACDEIFITIEANIGQLTQAFLKVKEAFLQTGEALGQAFRDYARPETDTEDL